MEKKCSKCLVLKPYSSFGKNKTTKDGFSYECKSCGYIRYKKYKEKILNGDNFVNEKKCKCCNQIKNRNEFTINTGKDGLFPYCKECNRKLSKEKYHSGVNRDSIRNSTNKYQRRLYMESERNRVMRNLTRNFNLFIIKPRVRKKWSKYEILIGYEISELLLKIGNRPSSDYQIDHKIPISWFSNDCPFNIIWDMRNLWWVSREYNSKKRNYWCDIVDQEYLEIVKPFLIKELIYYNEYLN